MAHSQNVGEIDKSVIHDPWGLLGTKVDYASCPKCGHRLSTVYFYDYTGGIRVKCDKCGECHEAITGAYSPAPAPITINLA